MRTLNMLLIGAALALAASAQANAQQGAGGEKGFNWTGIYIGAIGGYAFGAEAASGFRGGVAGGTFGFNLQPSGSGFIFGIEGDGAWTNFGDSASATGSGVTVSVTSRAKAAATLRARFGPAFGHTLIYVTGGGAWVRNTISVTVTSGSYTAGISDTQNHFGYAVGGGVERAFANNWSAKIEYLYLGLESKTYFSSLGGVSTGDVGAHVVRAGLNYRFGYTKN